MNRQQYSSNWVLVEALFEALNAIQNNAFGALECASTTTPFLKPRFALSRTGALNSGEREFFLKCLAQALLLDGYKTAVDMKYLALSFDLLCKTCNEGSPVVGGHLCGAGEKGHRELPPKLRQ